MALSQKVFLQQGNYREIAGLWLTLSSVLGILGLLIASLAVVWTVGRYQAGELSLMTFLLEMTIFAGLILSPMVGWALFARRLYWAAVLAGTFPIVVATVGFVSTAL